jgi:hypothetical protein
MLTLMSNLVHHDKLCQYKKRALAIHSFSTFIVIVLYFLKDYIPVGLIILVICLFGEKIERKQDQPRPTRSNQMFSLFEMHPDF